MRTSSVTLKGQVVIPSEIRHKYGIKPGSQVAFYERSGEIFLVPVTERTIEENIGFLGTQGRLLKELAREKRREKQRDKF